MKLKPPPSFTVFGCKVKGKKETENLVFVAEVFLVRHLQGADLAVRPSVPYPILKKDDSVFAAG